MKETFIYDRFDNEIYEGDTYWDIEGYILADLGRGENYWPENNIIATLVEELGTEQILERLGYSRKVFQ